MVASGLKVFFTLGAFLILSACLPIPIKDTFFEPSAEGGKVTRVTCRAFGYPNYLEFERERVFLQIGSHLEKEYLSLSFYLRIPQDISVSFRSNEFIWSSAGQTQHIKPKSIQAHVFVQPQHKETIPVSDWLTLQGGYHDAYGGWRDAYTVSFDLPIKENNFSFQLPPLRINDKEAVLPQINFTLKTGWYWYPINC